MSTHASSGIWLIDVVTARFMRTVIENRASPVITTAITSWFQLAELQRTATYPGTPQQRHPGGGVHQDPRGDRVELTIVDDCGRPWTIARTYPTSTVPTRQ